MVWSEEAQGAERACGPEFALPSWNPVPVRSFRTMREAALTAPAGLRFQQFSIVALAFASLCANHWPIHGKNQLPSLAPLAAVFPLSCGACRAKAKAFTDTQHLRMSRPSTAWLTVPLSTGPSNARSCSSSSRNFSLCSGSTVTKALRNVALPSANRYSVCFGRHCYKLPMGT